MNKDFLYGKKSNCKCYYLEKFQCRFKKSCNFPICKFYTTEKPEKPIKNRQEYLAIKYNLEDKKYKLPSIDNKNKKKNENLKQE